MAKRRRAPESKDVFPPLKTARGGVLAVALRPGASALAKMIVTFVLAGFWNGFCVTFFVKTLLEGEYVASAFLSLFVLVGLGLLALFVHQLLYFLFTGDPALEVEREPLSPGERSRVYLHHPGKFEVESLSLALVCKEVVSYRRGTDTVTHREKVAEVPILSQSAAEVGSSRPLRLNASFTVPEGAMHSFKANRNEVAWGIQVEIKIPGRPDVNEFYPIRIAP